MGLIFEYCPDIVSGLLIPLGRLLIFMSFSLLLANFLEVMHWTRFIAKLSAPLINLGHMGETASAAFTLSFFSSSSANALLSEDYANKKISRRELILSNLFNSSPAFFLHLPTLTSLAVSFLGVQGLIYVGLSFLAALIRSLLTAIYGRLYLPKPMAKAQQQDSSKAKLSLQDIYKKIWQRFKKRILKIIFFTAPIYTIFFIMQKLGWFKAAQELMSRQGMLVSILNPETLGIVALHFAAEFSAALSAAAALYASGNITIPEITMALLVGNILSSPVRALRHQLPGYSGYYTPSMALSLVLINQLARALSLIVVTILYYLAFF